MRFRVEDKLEEEGIILAYINKAELKWLDQRPVKSFLSEAPKIDYFDLAYRLLEALKVSMHRFYLVNDKNRTYLIYQEKLKNYKESKWKEFKLGSPQEFVKRVKSKDSKMRRIKHS